MSEPFLGEIRIFAGGFAPRGWAFCDGQLLAISQNDALFSLFGTIYGGDGETTYGLPDLRGRLPIHAGSGPGLSPRPLGAKGGQEAITLTVGQLPSHGHPLQVSSDPATSPSPPDNSFARTVGDAYVPDLTAQEMNSSVVGAVGGGLTHSNLMPYLCVNFIVALVGIYPSS